MKEKSEENAVQTYISGKFIHTKGSIAHLSDNGTEFQNAVCTDACEQHDIKRLFSNPFHPQGNLRNENAHNFLKRTLTQFLDSNNLKWDKLLPFACYCYNIFPGSNGTEPFISYVWLWTIRRLTNSLKQLQ